MDEIQTTETEIIQHDPLEVELLEYADALSVMPKDSAAASEDTEGLILKADYLMAVNARTGQIMADVQSIISIKRGAYTRANLKLPATHLKELLASHVAFEQRIYDLAERLNRNTVHTSDLIRTIISLRKEEMIQERMRSGLQSDPLKPFYPV